MESPPHLTSSLFGLEPEAGAPSGSRRQGTGRDFDWLLLEHFSAEIRQRYGRDVSADVRSRLRLLQSCERLKKVRPLPLGVLVDHIFHQHFCPQ